MIALPAKGKDVVRQKKGRINKQMKDAKGIFLPTLQLNCLGPTLVITSSELIATYTEFQLSSS